MPSFSAIIATLLVARVVSGIQSRLPQLIRAAVLAIEIPVAAPAPIVSVSVSIAITVSIPIPIPIPIVAIIPIVAVVIRILGLVSPLEC